MANKVVIDVEARFIDHLSGGATTASKKIDNIGKEAQEAGKKLDSLAKKKIKSLLDVDNNKLLKKLKTSESKLAKFAGKKIEAILTALDKASPVIEKLLSKGKAFGNKVWSAALKFKDSGALDTVRKITSAAESFTKKTWTAAIKIKDMATAPLRGIKNTLFSIRGLVAAVTAGFAAKQLVLNPVATADTIESARIGFESKLGSSTAAENFLQSIYKFDEKSPFDTMQIVGITQQMMNMGWTAKNVLEDLGTIGDWAASMGKGEEGISAVTRALGQMRMKGKLSSEEIKKAIVSVISNDGKNKPCEPTEKGCASHGMVWQEMAA